VRPRRLLGGIATVLLVVVVLVLIVGQLLGQPLLVGFVTSGSMEPTLSPGDGFVAVPPALAGEPQEGDVVVYEAETVRGGGLTTHRVVAETDRGFVTTGDANPFTDQDGGEPHVSEADVVAHALQVNGEVVSIPHLGTAVTTTRGAVAAPVRILGVENAGTVLVFLGMALMLLAGATGGGATRETSRSRSRANLIAVWVIVLLAAGVVTAAATMAMVVPAGGYDVEVVVTDAPTDDGQVVAPGGTAEVSYELHNAGVVPALVVTEPQARRTSVDPPRTTLTFDDRDRVTVRIDAPRANGEYSYRVRESRYLLVLPPALLVALHSVHPLLALLAVDLVLAAFVITVAVGIFGTGYLRVRQSPDVPLTVRIERRLRRYR
jgi:signal peptidase